MAVYFYYGEEDYNIDLAIDELKSKLNPDFIALNFQKLDNPKYPQLITILRTPPMMFGSMLAVINADRYLLSKENYFEDSELDDIKEPTLVFFVGDHFPSLRGETSVYNQLGLTGANCDTLYQQKYFFWSNYDADFSYIPENEVSFFYTPPLQLCRE